MPIQIRGELLLAGHAPASIWEVRFHFCGDPKDRPEEGLRCPVLRRSAAIALSTQQSAFSQAIYRKEREGRKVAR